MGDYSRKMSTIQLTMKDYHSLLAGLDILPVFDLHGSCSFHYVISGYEFCPVFYG